MHGLLGFRVHRRLSQARASRGPTFHGCRKSYFLINWSNVYTVKAAEGVSSSPYTLNDKRLP